MMPDMTLAEKLFILGGLIEIEGPGKGLVILRAEGLLSVCLPKEYGGSGYEISPDGMLPMLRILKTVGRGSLAVGRIYEGHLNALRLIHTFGSESQRERWSKDAREGHVFGIWNTGQGDEDVELKEISRGDVLLKGAKVFASGAELVTRPIISAKNSAGGSQLIVLEPPADGFEFDRTTWDPMGMVGSVSHRLDVTGMEIRREALLGEPDSYSKQPWLSAGAMRFAAVQLGGAESLLEITRHHLKATGRTEHPYQEERVSKMLMDCESGNLWLEGAAQRAALEECHPEKLVHYVGMMRTAVERICFRTMRNSQQCIGLQGMLKPHPLERVTRDLMTYLRQPNPDGSFVGSGRYALASDEALENLWREKPQ